MKFNYFCIVSLVLAVTGGRGLYGQIDVPYELQPNIPPCTFDVEAGVNRDADAVVLMEGLLAQETPAELEAHLKDASFIKLFAHVSQEPGYRYLHFTIEIGSPQIQSMYGTLELDGLVQIETLGGDILTLKQMQTDDGMVDVANHRLIYRSQVLLNKRTEKKLLRDGIDHITVYWSGSYQRFDVAAAYFVSEQIECLNNLK